MPSVVCYTPTMKCKACDRPFEGSGRFCSPRCRRQFEGIGLERKSPRGAPRDFGGPASEPDDDLTLPEKWQAKERSMRARYRGTCPTCDQQIKVGQLIYMWLGKAHHVNCDRRTTSLQRRRAA